MPKETSDMATLNSETKYEAKNAPVRKFGGNDSIHDGIRTMDSSPIPPLKSGSYDKGRGEKGEGAE